MPSKEINNGMVLKLLYFIDTLIRATWLNKIVFYTAVIAGCVVAFSPAEAGLQPQLNDKFLHIVGFFIMAILAHLAHPKSNEYVLIIGLATFGILVEIVQAYLPYRQFSLWDWCADIFGVTVYFVFFGRMLKYRFSPD